jgi:metallo-beta-lactamase family protein
MNPKLTFHTGVGTVTGANFMLDFAGKKVLIDCGLIQGGRFCAEENYVPFTYDVGSIDILFVTHAHMDHIGRIPKLVKAGFTGVIYSTPETKAIARVMLEDGVKLLAREAKNIDKDPLYDEKDISRAFENWKELQYHEEFTIAPDFTIKLYDAGHILGSAMFVFTMGGKKILFTGDSGNSPTPLLRDTEFVSGVDYAVIDSVYGDRNHEPLEERRARFLKVIQDSIARGGTLMIPTFSIERTQVILSELNDFVESGKIKSVPVFVDSPLAIKVTDVYRNSTHLFNDAAKAQIAAGDDPFIFPKLTFAFTVNDSKEIEETKGPKIILAGSGMSSGGRIVRHEKNYLPDSKNTILFVGYQTAGSLGRQISEGLKTVTIDGEEIPVKAHIEKVSGYSAHKDSDHLTDMVDHMGSQIKKVFVVMGEPKSALFLTQKLRDNLGVNAVTPDAGKVYEL